MKLTAQELDFLKANSLNMANAKDMAELIKSDVTLGGIFPNAATGDFSNPNTKLFSEKWCAIWDWAKILLRLAKIFTNDKIDKVIDALLALGNKVCPSMKS